MVGWHHRLDGHEFEQVMGVGDGQGSLVWGSPWGRKELDTTEQLNKTLSPPEDHIPLDGDLPSGKGTKPGGEGKGYPLQYSSLENPMDCIVHGVTKSQTPLYLCLHCMYIHTGIQTPEGRNRPLGSLISLKP